LDQFQNYQRNVPALALLTPSIELLSTEDLKSYAIRQAKLRLRRWDRTPERMESLTPIGTFDDLSRILLLPGGDMLCLLFHTGDISLNRVNVSSGSPALVCMGQYLSGDSEARHWGWLITSTTPYVLFTMGGSSALRSENFATSFKTPSTHFCTGL
jgi:hypothetical protein